MGHLRKLGTKTHFTKLTHILPLKKAWGCSYKGLFLLSPSAPSSVDCVELKLEYTTSTLHRGRSGEGRCLNLRSYCVSVPRVLTRVVGAQNKDVVTKGLVPCARRLNYTVNSLYYGHPNGTCVGILLQHESVMARPFKYLWKHL